MWPSFSKANSSRVQLACRRPSLHQLAAGAAARLERTSTEGHGKGNSQTGEVRGKQRRLGLSAAQNQSCCTVRMQLLLLSFAGRQLSKHCSAFLPAFTAGAEGACPAAACQVAACWAGAYPACTQVCKGVRGKGGHAGCLFDGQLHTHPNSSSAHSAGSRTHNPAPHTQACMHCGIGLYHCHAPEARRRRASHEGRRHARAEAWRRHAWWWHARPAGQ